jgi:hypothetical protein
MSDTRWLARIGELANVKLSGPSQVFTVLPAAFYCSILDSSVRPPAFHTSRRSQFLLWPQRENL